jgi:molybdopterin synthase catalytic subunit
LGQIGLHKKDEIDLTTVVSELRKHPDAEKAGAIATFIGIVRKDPVDQRGRSVKYLDYEAYEEAALREMDRIRNEMLAREGVIDVSIHHVIDRLAVGEASIFVAVLGRHRKHVFPVLEATVDRVKRDVPIWKKEVTDTSAYWVASD